MFENIDEPETTNQPDNELPGVWESVPAIEGRVTVSNISVPEVINPLDPKHWPCGGRKFVLGTYLKLATGVLSPHWLYAAADRIAAGDDEAVVMADFGYERKEPT